MTRLLDGNVLVALAIRGHEFHDRCATWMAALLDGGGPFATCPLVEGTLLRVHLRLDPNHSAAAAWDALREVRAMAGHESWLENFSYTEVPHAHLRGHRQVTDAWLVELARRRGGKLATLDAALATLHPELVELIPVVW